MDTAGRQAGIESPLLELAAQQATGCLVITDAAGEDALVWLRDGDIYAVSVPGRRPLLGVRLVSSGVITPEALTEALTVQRNELRGWRLGELLVHLGYVQRPVVDDFVAEQMNDQMADLLGWTVRMSRFRNGESTRQDMTQAHEVSVLLAEGAARRSRWAAILERVGGPETVVDLDSGAGPATQDELGPHEWAVLCKVDGNRTLIELADECGFTLFETARLIADLTEAGLVTLPLFSRPPTRDPAKVEPAAEPLAKVLQLHPPVEPIFDTPEPESPSWTLMAEAASLLTEFASDVHSRDFLDADPETIADPGPELPIQATVAEAKDQFDSELEQAEPEAEEEPDADEPESDEPEADEEDEALDPTEAQQFTDTASLLRELSSLGTVANDESGPRLSSTTRPPGASDPHSRKKRGFLGR